MKYIQESGVCFGFEIVHGGEIVGMGCSIGRVMMGTGWAIVTLNMPGSGWVGPWFQEKGTQVRAIEMRATKNWCAEDQGPLDCALGDDSQRVQTLMKGHPELPTTQRQCKQQLDVVSVTTMYSN